MIPIGEISMPFSFGFELYKWTVPTQKVCYDKDLIFLPSRPPLNDYFYNSSWKQIINYWYHYVRKEFSITLATIVIRVVIELLHTGKF